jgi:hypothetical protein
MVAVMGRPVVLVVLVVAGEVVALPVVQEIHQLLLQVKVIVVLVAGRPPVVAEVVAVQAQSVRSE